jgi:hypothetical protein
VEDVHLHGGHGVQVSQDDVYRLPVPGDVDMEPPPAEARPVLDPEAGKVVRFAVRGDQLREGLEAPQDPHRGGGLEEDRPGGDFEEVRFVGAGRLDAFPVPPAAQDQRRLPPVRALRGEARPPPHPFEQAVGGRGDAGVAARVQGENQVSVKAMNPGLCFQGLRPGHDRGRPGRRRGAFGCPGRQRPCQQQDGEYQASAPHQPSRRAPGRRGAEAPS